MSWSVYRWLWVIGVRAGMAHGLLVAIGRLLSPEVVLIGVGMAAQGMVSGWLVGRGGSVSLRVQVLAVGLLYAVVTLAGVGIVLAHGWGGTSSQVSSTSAGSRCTGGFAGRRRQRTGARPFTRRSVSLARTG